MACDRQTLMVATDFSEASEAALTYAFHLARTLHTRLDIVHVVPESDVQILTSLREHLQSQITAETLREVLCADADKRLAEMIERADAKALIEERLIVTGQPAETLVSWAASKQPRILILGTHRRRGIDHLLLGSVAEQVLRQASCSVLIVPATSTMT
ncbi:universal stress protein [Candidatus Entotheonella palauensis]|uniref:universal stress protein n=1 Tax=Candidatus Entotheonella palauensis TaxID=93172 RepID=UPI000B7D09D3|nr:universal stress protein [Candidatus Entotheonella palauensis]